MKSWFQSTLCRDLSEGGKMDSLGIGKGVLIVEVSNKLVVGSCKVLRLDSSLSHYGHEI
jgi:hypothetical protein